MNDKHGACEISSGGRGQLHRNHLEAARVLLVCGGVPGREVGHQAVLASLREPRSLVRSIISNPAASRSRRQHSSL